MRISLLTWNVAGRVGVQPRQAAAVVRHEPDLVALQEVRPSTLPAWREALADEGLAHAVDSATFRRTRRIFNLTASRWPLVELPNVGAPQPERVLSALCESPAGPIELRNVHIPPAPSNGLVKVETCEALAHALARHSDRHRILCGDLNTPRYETEAGEVETFASNHPEHEERWDHAERTLLTGLKEWGIEDAFRKLNGYERRDVSWVLHTRARRKAAHRLDHILTSASLRPVWCDYLHEWREAGLSDHSALGALFEPEAARTAPV
jgi:exodeoxyribonuclease III